MDDKEALNFITSEAESLGLRVVTVDEAKAARTAEDAAGDDVERKVRELRGQEWGVNRIARELGIGSGTVRRIAYE